MLNILLHNKISEKTPIKMQVLQSSKHWHNNIDISFTYDS